MFIASELVTMYIFNVVNTTYANVTLGSPYGKDIIYSQFFITFAYFTYGFTYIVFTHKNLMNVIVLVVLGIIGFFCIAFSYINNSTVSYTFRVAGSASLTMGIVGIGLLYVKIRNK
jgi:hypothetical protein